jgi:hypothetical protein
MARVFQKICAMFCLHRHVQEKPIHCIRNPNRNDFSYARDALRSSSFPITDCFPHPAKSGFSQTCAGQMTAHRKIYSKIVSADSEVEVFQMPATSGKLRPIKVQTEKVPARGCDGLGINTHFEYTKPT